MSKFKFVIAAIVATITFITVYSKNQQQNSLSDLQKENIELMTTSSEPGIVLIMCYSPDSGKEVSGERYVNVCDKNTICPTLPWETLQYTGTTVYVCESKSFVTHILYRRGYCYKNVK